MNLTVFIKKHFSACVYALLGLITVVVGTILLVWTIRGDAERLVEFRSAALVGENYRTEYLVGQSFDTEGLALNIGTADKPEIIAAADCDVTADLTSAGNKTVEIIYPLDEFTSYVAKVNVDVIYVRNLEIETYPEKLEVSADGTVTADENFAAYVMLASAPQTDVFGPAENTGKGYRVRLTDGMYKISCVGDSSVADFYNLTLYCGDVSASFGFYNAAGRSFIVSSAKDIVTYVNADDASSAALTLIVTERDDGYRVDCTGETAGYYVYRAADGTESLLPFAYSLEDKAENLNSAAQSAGLTERADDNAYTVAYDGQTFAASAAVFRSAVVGGRIYDDHGYKLVVASDERILRFTYDPVDPTDPADPGYVAPATANVATAAAVADPSLTLYVTAYDMNPLLGTGNGWSRGVYIYTDANGDSYKTAFYMQAWVWTYVPLSSSYSDVYDDVTIGDFVYNHEAPDDLKYNSYHRGTLYANVSQYDRGNGFKTVRFSVPDVCAEDGSTVLTSSEELWLAATMGM